MASLADPNAVRLFCDDDHQRLQARLRLQVSLLLAAVFLAIGGLGLLGGPPPVGLAAEVANGPRPGVLIWLGVGAAGYAGLAWLWLLLLRRPGAETDRGCAGRQPMLIAADLTMVGLMSLVLGVAGLALYPLLLWIILSNGFCFGPRHLGLAALMGAPVFAVAYLANGVAAAMPAAWLGLLLGVLILPRCTQHTLARMVEVNGALRQKKEEAEHLALHDGLTDLPNRNLLLQRLDHAINRSRRSGDQLAVVFIDLDGFKRINDSQGHNAGDALLVQIAACLRACVREVDTLCRLGGDEFILLIEDCGSAQDLNGIVERLFGCARRFYRVQDADSYVTWSCGVAVYPRDGGDSGTLLRNADIAMYRAKARGGDCAVHYDPAMSRQVLRDLTLRNELRRAIDQGEFEVVYQPQVDARTGRTLAIEALVRWRHPARGLLAPDEFLAVAVTSGLMAEVDAQVLATALTDLAALRRDGATDLRLAVNLSARQLAAPDFDARLAAMLDASGLPPTVLDIESTEAVLLEEADLSRNQIRLLRRQGGRFVLDDFGTGYSSLTHLRRFAVDQVKIDQSFIRGLPDDSADAAMVEGILAVANRLTLSVAAEGVETAGQRDWLLEHGCGLQQGFHFGGPMPLPMLRELLGVPSPATPPPASPVRGYVEDEAGAAPG